MVMKYGGQNNMFILSLIPEEMTWHPPEGLLQVIKATFDVLTVVAFIGLAIVIYHAKNKYPVMERGKTFYPLIGFSLLGICSMFMDAVDEFFWFSPKEFYDVLWKPTRLLMFLMAIVLLVFSFYQFYKFSDRIFGGED